VLRVDVTGPVRAVLTGRPARFAVAVTNIGPVRLRGVMVGATVPGCSGALGDLGPGQAGRPLHCDRAMQFDDLANAVTATGTDPTGRAVTGTGAAIARWARTGIGVTAVPDTLWADAGSLINMTITMHNTGNVDLVNVAVTDPALPGCERVLDRLAAGTRQDWTCVTTAPPRGQVTNQVSATGTPDVEDAAAPLVARTTASVQVLAALPAEVLGPAATAPDPNRPRLATTAVRVDPATAFGIGLLIAGVLMVLVGLRRRRYPAGGAHRRR
jgi:uncharacterized repeat protein (TIGR01451 family)